MDAVIVIFLAHPFVVLFVLVGFGLVVNAAIGTAGLRGVTHPFHLYDLDHGKSRRFLTRASRRSSQADPPQH